MSIWTERLLAVLMKRFLHLITYEIKQSNHKDADFAIERIERVFDPIENSDDRKRLTKFRNSKADNSVHAGIRNSDLDIGREDLD
jgi:hypothetical protein